MNKRKRERANMPWQQRKKNQPNKSDDVGAGTSFQSLSSVVDVNQLSIDLGGQRVISNVTFSLQPGELLAIVGPSGSGKSTLLNAIAGFVAPTAGQIALHGDIVSQANFTLPPEARRIGMVFQSHALWPQMSVRENVAFPLRQQGQSKAAALDAADATIATMGLANFGHHFPEHLSGGQQQRVGLARALAANPKLFLFDEPTANLDAVNRQAFSDEVRRRQRAAGIACVYVTHHMQEAFEIADRVLVLMHGTVQQIGTPAEIYETPVSPAVAMLSGKCSLFEGIITDTHGPEHYSVRMAQEQITLRIRSQSPLQLHQPVRLMVRPEWCEARENAGLPATVQRVRYQGMATEYDLQTPVGQAFLRETGTPRFSAEVCIGWQPIQATVVDFKK